MIFDAFKILSKDMETKLNPNLPSRDNNLLREGLANRRYPTSAVLLRTLCGRKAAKL